MLLVWTCLVQTFVWAGRRPGAYEVSWNNVCVLICGKGGVVCGKRLTFLRNSLYEDKIKRLRSLS